MTSVQRIEPSLLGFVNIAKSDRFVETLTIKQIAHERNIVITDYGRTI